MFCIKCGKQLPDEAAFCFACGAKVYTDSSATPTASTAPVFDNLTTFTPSFENDPLAVAQDARVDAGNFFIDGETMYFLTHGYNNCEHTQLWKSDLQGRNKQCVLEFDKTPYMVTDFISVDDCYYMAKVDRLLLFHVEDEKNDYYNYYYHLDYETHGVIKDIPRLPYQISQDGNYFVKKTYDNAVDGGIILTLQTPYEALKGQAGKEIRLNSETGLFSNYEAVNLRSCDCFVYNDHQLLMSFYGGADSLDYLWARIDLFNMADYAILNPAQFELPERGSLIGNGSYVLFNGVRTDNCVLVDTTDMTIKATVPMHYPSITTYGSLAYFSSYNVEKTYVMDLKTGNTKALSDEVRVFGATSSKNIRQTPAGYYKYSYNNADTEICFLSNAELFQATDDDDILPMISLTYSRNFKPTVRNAAMDENVYTRYNTRELSSAAYEYLQKTNVELARKYDSTFFYSGYVTLPDGKRVGFVYGHKQGYENEKNDYYNLYELNLDGTYRYLGCGSRGGIEHLKIYKNYAYWVDFVTYRYDFVTGEFLESRDEWLEEEYKAVCNKETRDQL